MLEDLRLIQEPELPIDSFPAEAIKDIYTKNLDEFEVQKIQKLKLKNTELENNNSERKRYALWIFILTCAWAFLIFLIIFLQGFGTVVTFKITDSVMITLITSTTINFFGFFLLVIRYLFATKLTFKKEKIKKHTKASKKFN